jgi:predicted metal-dependent phosphoesterase TrpH
MHSTVSDGTDSPEALLQRVRAAGIGHFSLTDHDAVQGCARILAVRKPDDPAFLPGVEFSCRDEAGKYHILGYGYDPESKPIQSVVAFGHDLRMKKVRMRLEHLQERFGFSFPEQEIQSLLSQDNPGKPHIGNLMTKLGYADSKEKAIKEYIDRLRIRSDSVRPEQAIQGILASGGIPVLAHPCYGSGDELILGDDLDRRVRKLMDLGLQGVEALYSGFSEKLRQQVLTLAEKYSLYVTAGSDYHGTNKLVTLGTTGLTDTARVPDGLLRFLRDIGSKEVGT